MMKRLWITLLIIILMGGMLISLNLFVSQASTSAVLNRPFDPIILSGDQLVTLQGHSIDGIFVYAFAGTNSIQIPSQIDERNAEGVFVPVGDGLLDLTDELVFLADDAGDWVSDAAIEIGGATITPTYVLTLTDPISNDQAWAYVFSSPLISQTYSADYVSYDPGADRINSDTYATGFDALHGFRDYLTIGSSSDLLDREKFRVAGYLAIPSFPFSVNEDDITLDAVHALDGPVRVTRVATSTMVLAGQSLTSRGTTFFYPALIVQPATFSTPDPPVNITSFRISTDLNTNAIGGLYRDIHNTNVLVDGLPDSIVLSPATDWISISFAEGMYTYAATIPATLPNPTTYYKDDSSIDPNDTGDQMSYGDAGLFVNDPPESQAYNWLVHNYLDTQPDSDPVTHYQYYLNPIAVDVAIYAPPGPPPEPTLTPSITPSSTPEPTSTPIPLWGQYLPLVLRTP